MSRVFFVGVTPLLMAMTISIVGCNKSANKTASSDTGAKIDPNILADKQVITINNGTEPESLDPHKVSGVPEAGVIRQMLVGLVTTDKDGKIIPGMAEKWESPDNKVWTFHLRDAKWSNGDPVTAEDFAYSFKRVLNPSTASPYASYLADLKVKNAQEIIDGKAKPEELGVKVIDPKTLQITLIEPVPYFPSTLFHTSTVPVHKATVEKFGDKWTDPANIVVNGPYKITQWLVNDKIVLERNKNYYDDAHTKINKATLLPINQSTTDVTRYKAGEIDVTSTEIPSEQFQSLKQEFGDQLKVAPSLCTYYYEFNTVKPPFNDPKVRRALALALDRDVITQKVVGQGQTSAYQFTPPSVNGGVRNTPVWQGWDKAKRIEEAKKLLTEAGYGPNKPLSFELLYNTSESHKKIAVAVTELWKQALGNINVTLTNKEWKTFLETRQHGTFDVARAGWCGDYNEPSTFLNILKSKNSNNNGKYNSPAFDNIMMQTLKAGVDDAQRIKLYNQAEAQIDTDMPLLSIYHYVSPRMIKPYVIGFSRTDALDQWQIKDMSIAKH